MAVEFPAFLKVEYQRTGAAKTMLADIESALGDAEGRFRQFSTEAQRQLDQALSVKRNAGGSLDLGVAEMQASATALKARAAAAREVAQATEIAARETGDYSQSAQLAIRATQALAVQEERAAEEALAHAQALQQVQTVLNRTASSTDAVVKSTQRGTDAYGIHTNSLRGSRIAMIQTGQQMQDMAIQFQAGTRTSVIFAQQIPQFLFALTSLEGSSNKTAARVGAFATLLSGPWSIAVVAGAAVLGGLIDKYVLSGEAADEAKGKSYDFSRGLDVMALSAKQTADAMQQLADATKGAIEVQGDFLNQQAAVAKGAVSQIEQRIRDRSGQITEVRNNRDDYAGFGYFKLNELENAQKLDQQALAAAKAAAANADLARIQREVSDSMDAGSAAVNRYKTEIGALNERYRAYREGRGDPLADNQINEAFYKSEFSRLTKLKEAAEEAAKAKEKIARPETIGPADVAAIFGLKQGQYGGTRTAKRNAEVGGADNSYHRIGQAIDIPLTINGKKLTKDGIRAELEAAGIKIKELLGPGDKGHSDHFHIAFAKTKKSAEEVAEAAERAAEALADFGDRSAEKIDRINERFDEQPRLIDAANAATRDLDRTIAELAERKPFGFEQMIADAQAAKATIEEALVRPFEELTRESERRLEIDRLITAGKFDEADALQVIWRLESQIGDLTGERKQDILDQIRVERLLSEELMRRRELIGQYLDATRSVKQELVSIFAGQGSLGNFQKIFQNLQAQITVEKLFGPALRELDEWVKGQSGIKASVDFMADETKRAGDAAMEFAAALSDAATKVQNPAISTGSSAVDAMFAPIYRGAANDNISIRTPVSAVSSEAFGPEGFETGAIESAIGEATNEIVVVARRVESVRQTLEPRRWAQELAKSMTLPLNDGLSQLFGAKLGGQLGGVISGGLAGLITAGPAGGILGSLQQIAGENSKLGKVFGSALDGAQTGSQIAGLANSFGIKLDSNGAQIGGAIGSFLPIPGGELIGALAGGIIGKLFKKTKKGYAIISNTGVTTGGNSGSLTEQAGQTGSGIQDTLQSIADQLGGSIGNYAVSIGARSSGWIHVDASGASNVGDGNWYGRAGSNAIYNGKSMEAAIRAALLNAIEDGAIQGIREGAQRLLRAGTDIEKQLSKALSFESVFKRLRAIKDPLGAAIDGLNKEFSNLKTIFSEAGASAAEYAELEELYSLERARVIKEASEQITGSLRQLLDDLTLNNPALSLRDRQSAALEAYNPLASRVAAGDTTAFDDYAEAARTLLEIERELYGSQSGYFDRLSEMTNLTQTTLDAQQALIDSTSASDSPFSNAPASAANDNQGVLDAIGQSNSYLAAINQNLINWQQQIAAGGGGSGFEWRSVNWY